MRNKYDDDGLLDDVQEEQPAVAEPSASEQQEAPLPMPTPQDKSAEELSLERSLAVLKEIDRVNEELLKKKETLNEHLRDVRRLQNTQSDAIQSMEKLLKKQYDVISDVERYNKEIISKFNAEYTLSGESRQSIRDILSDIVDKMVEDTKDSLSKDLEEFAQRIVDDTKKSLDNIKALYESSTAFLRKEGTELSDRITAMRETILIPKSKFWILAFLSAVLFASGCFCFLSYNNKTDSGSLATMIVAGIFCISTLVLSWYLNSSEDNSKTQKHPAPMTLSFSQVLYWMGVTVMSVVWITIGLTGSYSFSYVEFLAYLYAASVGSNFISLLLQYLANGILRR